jgi:hypothetical protein
MGRSDVYFWEGCQKSIVLSTGEQISLGSWRLDGGDNVVVVSGRTSPVRSKTELEIELEANLRF